MPTQITGTTGVSKVQDSAVTASALAAGAVTAGKMAAAQPGSAPIGGLRGFAFINGTTTGTYAPIAGFGFTTIQRVSSGIYVVTFPNTGTLLYGMTHGIGSTTSQPLVEIDTRTMTSCRVVVTRRDTGAVQDAGEMTLFLAY